MSRKRKKNHLTKRVRSSALGDFVFQGRKRLLGADEIPDFGQVVFSDGSDEFVFEEDDENESMRDFLASRCPLCAAGHVHVDE